MTIMSKTGKPINEAGGYDEVQAHTGRTDYLLNGQLHRVNGPARISAEGDEHWYERGRRHRIGGPALISRNGASQWWVDGIQTADVPRTGNV